MSETLLLNIPKFETWSTEHFLQQSQLCCEVGGAVLNFCSENVEKATRELLHILRSTAFLPAINDFDSEEVAKSKKEEIEMFDNECDEVFKYLRHKDQDALVTSTRSTLEALRKRIIPPSSSISPPDDYHSRAMSLDETHLTPSLFQADLILSTNRSHIKYGPLFYYLYLECLFD